ncbi:hypothetical protein D3C87_1542750 [compost metagenome]
MQAGGRLLDSVVSGHAQQRLLLGQCLDYLLDEKRIALGLFQDSLLERGESGIIAQQGTEQTLRFGRPQGRQHELGVAALWAPSRLVLGPVVHQEKDAGIRQALRQECEERLRLGVQPLQVLEQELDRLIQAFAHQQARDRIKGTLAPDTGVHVAQRRALLVDT